MFDCVLQDVRKASELEAAMEKQKLKIDIAETGQMWETNSIKKKYKRNVYMTLTWRCECELVQFLDCDYIKQTNHYWTGTIT